PFRSSRLIGAERQPTSDCRQSLQQSQNQELIKGLLSTIAEKEKKANDKAAQAAQKAAAADGAAGQAENTNTEAAE
ncbi:hypothetical protein LZL19_12085, partial [Pseudomonas aeruginosa]|nr:hypothetical protein [Pseudomonas aeruginosa]